MFRLILVAWISWSLAYTPIALAQSFWRPPVGWTPIIGSDGLGGWIGPANVKSGQAGAGQAVWKAYQDGVQVTTPVSLPTSSGSLSVSNAVRVTPASAAVSIGKFAARVATPLAVGVALYDLAKELGFTLNKNPSTGAVDVIKDGVKGTTCGTSPQSAPAIQQCNGSWAGPCHTEMTPFVSYQIPQQRCNVVSNYYGSVYSEIYDWQNTTGQSAPASISDFVNTIAAKSGWPTTSALGSALKDAVNSDPADSVPSSPLSVTGPATITGPAVTTTSVNTPSVGDKTTTTTTTTPVTTNTYKTENNQNSVTTSTVNNTVTSVYNNTTNTTISTTNTATPAVAPAPAPAPDALPDFCVTNPHVVSCAAVDDLDMCKKYPDSLACKKTDEPEVPDLEKIDKPITFAPDSGWMSGAGSCPAPRHLSSGMGAEFSFTPYCDYMRALRPVFIGVAWLAGAMILIGANRKE